MADDKLEVEVIEGMPVVVAPMEIDITNTEALRSALLKAAADGSRVVVVDMSRTQFCDSSGLHALLTAHKRAGEEGREVLLVLGHPTVRRVFEITGIDRLIPTFPSLPEALAEALARIPAVEDPLQA